MRSAFIAICLSCVVLAGTAGAAAPPPALGMIQADVRGQRIEGTPLTWDANNVYLLGRDGRLWSFKPAEATNFRQIATRFQPYSVSELRAALLRELGNGYEVTGTAHYLVAHPSGQRDQWAQRFEDLYGSFVRYFSVRGFTLTQPPFPLIGIVCRDRADFDRHAAKQGMSSAAGVLGFYDLESNRIILYDVQQPGGGDDWRRNASTVIHEATHQMAFNTGVHSRYCPPPLWVVEGLATLFEAPGVHDSRSTTQLGDRTNRERLRDYQLALAGKHDGRLPAELTASDRFFQVSPAVAYAEAWALTFYLVETQSRRFARYLALTASHPPFSEYTAKQRLGDFTSVFGGDWRQFDAQFGRFMEGVK
ncbi:MAG TPA: DUF1570 domain-containing protein [Thermoguttaceae bacterium]|nr:DUF1570 domain-containing protein [Thermoguttaceae bacterium]